MVHWRGTNASRRIGAGQDGDRGVPAISEADHVETGARARTEERLAYRPAELAAMVGLSVKAIYRAIERGELPATRVANGSRLLIPAAAAHEWLGVGGPARQGTHHGKRSTHRRGLERPLGDAFKGLGHKGASMSVPGFDRWR